MTRELNARAENALIHDGRAFATGNFHAAELGAALDGLRAAFAHSASLIAGRVSAILDPRMSGLPPFLADEPGPGLRPHDARVHRSRRRRRGALAGGADGDPERVGLARGGVAREPGGDGRVPDAQLLDAMGVLVATELVVAVRALRLRGRGPAGGGRPGAVRRRRPGAARRTSGTAPSATTSRPRASCSPRHPRGSLIRHQSDLERTDMGVQEQEQLWGGETTKAVANFPVSGERVPVPVIRWLGRIKGAAARVNAELGLLDQDKAMRIAAAGDRIAEGEFDDQFPIDVFQTGSGTSSNMNANEVIATLAGEDVHRNDDVNMGQSSNDVFPSAVHLAALDTATNELLPALEQLEASLQRKADEFNDMVKSGRTHLMDAVPVTLGPGVLGLRGSGPPRRAANL